MRTADDLRSRIIEITGPKHVYLEPPSRLQYPCVLIQLNSKSLNRADNVNNYITHNRYQLMIISEEDMDVIVDELLGLPYCSYDRSYATDNLNHTNLTIYF